MDLLSQAAYEAFLRKKKIDPIRFGSSNPVLYRRIMQEYDRGGEVIVEYGKKFLWNELRMEFPLDNAQLPEE